MNKSYVNNKYDILFNKIWLNEGLLPYYLIFIYIYMYV